MNNFKNFESFKVENDKAVNGGWFSFGSYGGWGGNTYSGWGSASAVGNGGAGGAGGA